MLKKAGKLLSKSELIAKINAQEQELMSLRTTIAIQRAFIQQSLGLDVDHDLRQMEEDDELVRATSRGSRSRPSMSTWPRIPVTSEL